jgi:hypothetical protein
VLKQNNANCFLPNRQSAMQLSSEEKAALQSGEFSCVSMYHDKIVKFMLTHSSQSDPQQVLFLFLLSSCIWRCEHDLMFWLCGWQTDWIKLFNKAADDRRALQYYFRVGKDADRARDGKPQEFVHESHVITRLRGIFTCLFDVRYFVSQLIFVFVIVIEQLWLKMYLLSWPAVVCHQW